MNRTPSSRPSPPMGEKVPDGRLMAPIRVQFLEIVPAYEPKVCSRRGNEADQLLATRVCSAS
jgi:hypothetical protein